MNSWRRTLSCSREHLFLRPWVRLVLGLTPWAASSAVLSGGMLSVIGEHLRSSGSGVVLSPSLEPCSLHPATSSTRSRRTSIAHVFEPSAPVPHDHRLGPAPLRITRCTAFVMRWPWPSTTTSFALISGPRRLCGIVCSHADLLLYLDPSRSNRRVVLCRYGSVRRTERKQLAELLTLPCAWVHEYLFAARCCRARMCVGRILGYGETWGLGGLSIPQHQEKSTHSLGKSPLRCLKRGWINSG